MIWKLLSIPRVFNVCIDMRPLWNFITTNVQGQRRLNISSPELPIAAFKALSNPYNANETVAPGN